MEVVDHAHTSTLSPPPNAKPNLANTTRPRDEIPSHRIPRQHLDQRFPLGIRQTTHRASDKRSGLHHRHPWPKRVYVIDVDMSRSQCSAHNLVPGRVNGSTAP